jgi:hypothetical protein
MAIIACPDCGKKISSRAAICSWCGFQLGEVTEQDLEVYRARKLRDARYRLNMLSYAVITVMLAAFGWYWWDSKGFVEPPSAGPMILMGLAALAYLVVRALLFRNRRLQRAQREMRSLQDGLRRRP